MYKTIDEMPAYQLAMTLGETIWETVSTWNFFERDTVGKQLVRCTDSIAANIAESHGRHFRKDRKQFLIYARGSATEAYCFITKCENRQLMSPEKAQESRTQLRQIIYQINQLRNHLNTLKE